MKSTRAEIIDELEALGQHYMRPVRGPEQQERFLKDYLDDLSEYQISAIKLGCKAWRHSDASKFPTSGQLLRHVRANTATEHRGERAEPWRPLDDIEYDRLSLRDKIRHQTILGHEAQRKAGPMWANGAPAERPPARQTWVTRAENHFAEASRLNGILRRAEGAA
jgi:hypothetical protein